MTKAVYIHIPFCNHICSYCDFCKLLKDDNWINKYLEELGKEIKQNYKNEKINTLYIGGGTPSCLSLKQLEQLFKIIKIFNLNNNAEITFEANVEDLTKEKLEFLKDKINRLSIGIQTFNPKLLKLLERKEININNIKLAKKYFKNINADLMYNFNEETKNILKSDLNTLLKFNIPHISTYSLILEPHTKLYVKNYQIENEDTSNEEYINKILKDNGYNHYEISNYAKEGYESKHNLTYWNNEHYYGFGLGASGYINNERYENTKNITKYLQGNYKQESHFLNRNETMQNEFILGFRKLKGVNKQKFKQKYNIDIKELEVVKNLLGKKYLLENKTNIYINPKYLYYSNEILLNFVNVDLKIQ